MDASIIHQRASDVQRLRRNQRERTRYAAERDAISGRRREHRQSLLAARRNRFDYTVFGVAEEDISNLSDVISQRQQALHAARESTGVNIKIAEPCAHCGARISPKSLEGCAARTGKDFPLPYQRCRKHWRTCTAPPSHQRKSFGRSRGRTTANATSRLSTWKMGN